MTVNMVHVTVATLTSLRAGVATARRFNLLRAFVVAYIAEVAGLKAAGVDIVAAGSVTCVV